MTSVCWQGQSFTTTGHVRSLNEDAVIACDQQRLWAVADGMGGHDNGDYASQTVVAALGKYETATMPGVALSRLNTLLSDCNQHLLAKAEAAQASIIGCTVATLTLHGEHVVCSWSGDSRIYRLRRGDLSMLTRDHSHQSLSEDRDVMKFPESLNVDGQLLTAAIGGEARVHIEHCLYTLDRDDQFLICTDGLYKEVSDDEICATLIEFKQPETVISTLADLYDTRGARDNLGMVYVHAGPTS